MVRVEDALWTAAAEACRQLGTDRSTVMREALGQAIKRAARKRATQGA